MTDNKDLIAFLEKPCCSECRHSDVRKIRGYDDHLYDNRFCEVEPPKVFLSPDGVFETKFPSVYDHWKCGKFEPKNNKQEKIDINIIAEFEKLREENLRLRKSIDHLTGHVDCDTTSNYGYPEGEYK